MNFGTKPKLLRHATRADRALCELTRPHPVTGAWVPCSDPFMVKKVKL